MRTFRMSLLLVALLVGCTKEEPAPRSYPRLDTHEITQITDGGALFNGEIIYTSVPILDHGFVWSDVANFEVDDADRLSLGSKTGTGSFTASCTYALQEGKTYYVRAFAKSRDHAVYGDIMTFTSRGAEGPVLTDFNPKTGSWDDEITFVGKNFSANKKNINLRFGAFKAFVVYASADTIIANVPYDLDQPENELALSLGSQTATAAGNFVLKSPVIQSISPASAAAGSEVTLSGQYLNGANTKVYFGNVAGALKSISKTTIVCLVPDGVTGTLKVSVRTGQGALTDDIDFEIE